MRSSGLRAVEGSSIVLMLLAISSLLMPGPKSRCSVDCTGLATVDYRITDEQVDAAMKLSRLNL